MSRRDILEKLLTEINIYFVTIKDLFESSSQVQTYLILNSNGEAAFSPGYIPPSFMRSLQRIQGNISLYFVDSDLDPDELVRLVITDWRGFLLQLDDALGAIASPENVPEDTAQVNVLHVLNEKTAVITEYIQNLDGCCNN